MNINSLIVNILFFCFAESTEHILLIKGIEPFSFDSNHCYFFKKISLLKKYHR